MHGRSRWSLWPLLFSEHDAPKKVRQHPQGEAKAAAGGGP